MKSREEIIKKQIKNQKLKEKAEQAAEKSQNPTHDDENPIEKVYEANKENIKIDPNIREVNIGKDIQERKKIGIKIENISDKKEDNLASQSQVYRYTNKSIDFPSSRAIFKKRRLLSNSFSYSELGTIKNFTEYNIDIIDDLVKKLVLRYKPPVTEKIPLQEHEMIFVEKMGQTKSEKLDQEAKMEEILDIKYPYYDNPLLDSEVKKEITIESLLLDINECIDMLENFEASFSELLTAKNISPKIIEKFFKNKLDFCQCIVSAFFLRRELYLISILTQLRYSYKTNSQSIINILDFLEINYRKVLDKKLPNEKVFFKRSLYEDISILTNIKLKMLEIMEANKDNKFKKIKNYKNKKNNSGRIGTNLVFEQMDLGQPILPEETQATQVLQEQKLNEENIVNVETANRPKSFFFANSKKESKLQSEYSMLYSDLINISVDDVSIYKWLLTAYNNLDLWIERQLNTERKILTFYENDKNFIPALTSIAITVKFILANAQSTNKLLAELATMNKIESENLCLNFLTFCNEFELLAYYLAKSAKDPVTSIFNQPENSEVWQKINSHVQKRFLISRSVFDKKMKKIQGKIQSALACMASGYRNKEDQNTSWKAFKAAITLPYYLTRGKKADVRAQQYALNPDRDISIGYCNIMEKGFLNFLLKISLPYVKSSKECYLKKGYNEANINELMQIYNDFIKKNSIIGIESKKEVAQNLNVYEGKNKEFLDDPLAYDPLKGKEERTELIQKGTTGVSNNENLNVIQIEEEEKEFDHYKAQISGNKETSSKISNNKNNEHSHTVSLEIMKVNSDLDNLIEKKINKDFSNDYVKVRFISNRKFVIPSRQSLISKMIYKKDHNNSIHNSLIIHVHGGGFVSLSPSSQEIYTRRLSILTNIPIMSISYSLAPDYPYPVALNEVYLAYIWVLENAEKILNMKLDNIILIGDSSGGNLVAALTNLLICRNKRLPKAIFLVYPMLVLSEQDFFLSSLISVKDIILPHFLKKFYLQSYRSIHKEKNFKDPFISPIHARKEVLKEYPSTRIYIGSNDPLRDESYVFLNKLM